LLGVPEHASSAYFATFRQLNLPQFLTLVFVQLAKRAEKLDIRHPTVNDEFLWK
jgi:hypothetical protein